MLFLRHYWHPVSPSAELKSDPLTVQLLGQRYVVWRSADGVPSAAPPRCPHRGGNLGDGWVTDGCLVCPYHGWRYGPDGRCVHIPHLDAGLPIPPKARLAPVRVAERYGLIWLCPAEPAAPVPTWPEGEDPRFRLHVEFFEVRSTSAPRVVDNALDSSHVSFVHRGTFAADDGITMPPAPHVERTASGNVVGRFVFEMPGVGQQIGLQGRGTQAFERSTEIEILGPLCIRTRFRFTEFADESRDYCFLGGACPIDDTSSCYFRVTALGGTEEEHPFDRFHDFATQVQAEDRRVLDGTAPDFPLDVTEEVHLRIDRLTLEYRRYLAELAARHDAVRGDVRGEQ
jgi:phenylpropionate dioxygenase-like ring-hydroxylating dioxygenase large terminal subunit